MQGHGTHAGVTQGHGTRAGVTQRTAHADQLLLRLLLKPAAHVARLHSCVARHPACRTRSCRTRSWRAATPQSTLRCAMPLHRTGLCGAPGFDLLALRKDRQHRPASASVLRTSVPLCFMLDCLSLSVARASDAGKLLCGSSVPGCLSPTASGRGCRCGESLRQAAPSWVAAWAGASGRGVPRRPQQPSPRVSRPAGAMIAAYATYMLEQFDVVRQQVRWRRVWVWNAVRCIVERSAANVCTSCHVPLVTRRN